MYKVILGLYVAATSSALIFLKLGTKSGAILQHIGNKLHLNFNFYIAAGILMYSTSFILYTYLISKYDLGYIIPLTTAFVYIIIFVSSYFIFNEAFTATKIAGIALILTGLILLNLKSAN